MKKNIKVLTLIAGLVFTSLAFSACGGATTDNGKTPNGSNTTQGTQAGSQIKYDKEIGLNEAVTVEFPIKDGANTTTGKMTFLIKEFGEQNNMGDTTAISGNTFYYMIFDLTADAANVNTETSQPKILVELSAPQIVLLDANTMPSIGGGVGGAFNSNFCEEKGLTTFDILKTNHGELIHTATTWYVAKVDKPVFAIQYNDEQGNKHYIKINY